MQEKVKKTIPILYVGTVTFLFLAQAKNLRINIRNNCVHIFRHNFKGHCEDKVKVLSYILGPRKKFKTIDNYYSK